MTEKPWARHLRASLAELTVYDVPPADRSLVRLHANECPIEWPAEVMSAIGAAVEAVELGRYPDTSGRRVRQLLGERHGCDPDRIVLGNGSDEVIAFVITALSGTGAPLVIPTPTFVMYGHSARVMGMPVREVELDENFALREAEMAAALQDAALCFLARPNNPTGAVWDAGVVSRLVANHPATVFVIDEAYAAYEPGCSLWRSDLPSNQMHMSTLSKVGAAAMRLGYGIADPDLVTAMNKVRHPYNVSATTLAIAEVLLTRFSDTQDRLVAEARQLRDRLRTTLCGVDGAEVLPSGANLMLLRFAEPDRASELWSYLRDQNILVKDISKTPGLTGCLRISVGTATDLDRLQAALGAWTG